MTRFEEKLYLQSVFDAIDQVYNMKKSQKHSTYEERLRASFNKLLIPDWYNHEYTSTNGLRKTKSHGHVPRSKRHNMNTNSNNDDTPDLSLSSSTNSPHLSNGTHGQSYRHRSSSRSWSERAPLRRDSTTSSYDTNGSVINGRRSTTSNISSTYAPGVQRVAQSSTWYKPRSFSSKTTNGNSNGHSIEAPRPMPRCSKLEQERIYILDASLKIENVRYPIKPRTMAQAQVPDEESFSNLSSDNDVTLTEEPSTSEKPVNDNNTKTTTIISRTNSIRSISSEAESYRSAVLPPAYKNLVGTDSSSYASVSDRCLSPSSTASYHTARAGDTSSSSSVTGYETPTPQLDEDDNVTLSVHSSLSDLSHAETLEPNSEDLEIVDVSTTEQKSNIISSTPIGMEHLPLPTIPSTSANVDISTTIDSSLNKNTNRLDSSQRTAPVQVDSSEIREISNDEILREVDINAVGDEFFLFTPHDTTDNQVSNPQDNNNNNNNNHHHHQQQQQIERIESPTQASKRIFNMEDKTLNNIQDFHVSSTNDPFNLDDNDQQNNSSIMITNLDDLIVDDNDEENYLNANFRRPIQEDILYEVEHENSFSDHSQNTSSIIATDDKTSIKFDANIDYLTSSDSPLIDKVQETTRIESEKPVVSSATKVTNNNTLPLYALPPLYTTSGPIDPSSSLHIDTSDHGQNWDSVEHEFSDLTSPSIYTSKIRRRHYSVGSYYDHKTTTVTLIPNHSLYLLGSAPVSPMSRASTASSDSHYHLHHYPSPISYDNTSLSTLRRVSPFLDSNIYSSSASSYNYRRTTEYRSSSLNRDEKSRTITYTSPKLTSRSVERTIPVIQNEPPTITHQSLTSPSSTRKSSVTFSQYEVPLIHPKPTYDYPTIPPPLPPPRPTFTEQESSTIRRSVTRESPTSPSRSSTFEQESSVVVRPKTSRGRVRTPSPPARIKSVEKGYSQNIYQEIDSISTDDDQSTPNADLQFIRGAIDRVFHFHGDSLTDTISDSSTYYEEVKEDIRNDSKKTSSQYPAVEAIQRFYTSKTPSDSEKRISIEQVTNLDDIAVSQSSTSKKSPNHSVPLIPQKVDRTKTKLLDQGRASSEEVDDTLNDIEDVDSHDEKLKRPVVVQNFSSHTSNETSPLHSSIAQVKLTSQETQTINQQKPTIMSYPRTRTSVSPIEIVTNMVIERDDIDDVDGSAEMNEVSGEMVIFYDDIEIVEHSTSSCSTESESESSRSSSQRYSKPINLTIIEPPPIPARTLKPIHLANHQQQQQQQQQPPSKSNKTYELEKLIIRKKFDVNSVNDMLNRTDILEPSVSHRHPSARHFVGKLNSDDSSSQSTPITKTTVTTNGHKRTPTKSPFSNLPVRSSSALPSREKNRSIIADTNALVKQIQTSLSRNALHDTQSNTKTLSTSSKDLRAFVSSTYSPTDENMMDDNGTVHKRPPTNIPDDQTFKRQARLSKSFHNVSEYNSTDQHPKKENSSTLKTQPSKSVETNLDQISEHPIKQIHIPLNLTSVVTSTSFSALPNSDDNARMLSMKWYTGQVSENSEICYNAHLIDVNDLLNGYISTHSNRETQALLACLQASNDARIHSALDDIRSRVAQFDASKTQEDIHVFMRYLESRLRDLSNKKTSTRPISNDELSNGQQQADNISIKSRTSSTTIGANKDISSSRQLGRQHLRSSGSNGGVVGINSNQTTPPRRPSQSSANQENPAVFDEMLNTVLGLPKKGVSTLPQTFPYKRDKATPLVQTQVITNTTTTTTTNRAGRDIGKRLFESGTYKDPRLIYDGPKRKEKEDQPLETSV